MAEQWSERRERAIVATVAVSALLVPLNSTMIAVALPAIGRDLRLTAGTSGWFVLAYLITMASVQPVAGKLGDRFGRRPMLLGGMLLFGACSLVAGVAGQAAVIVAARCGQALAGGLAFPNGSALIRQITPSDRVGGRLGVVGSAIGFGAALGPPLGGVLVSAFGWRSIFLVNVPLVAVVFAAAWPLLPATGRIASGAAFDALGGLMLGAILAGTAWTLVRNEASLAAGVVVGGVLALAIVFARRELSHDDPVVDLRMVRRAPVLAAMFGVALSNLSLYGVLLGIPFVLTEERSYSASQVGAVLASMSVALVVASPVGGRLSDRYGRRAPVGAGLILLATSLLGLLVAGRGAPVPVFVVLLFLSGAGIAVASPGMQAAALESMPKDRAGMAAAAYSTSRYLGSIVGTSILASILSTGDGAFERVLVLVTAAAVLSLGAVPGLPGRRRVQDPSRVEGPRA